MVSTWQTLPIHGILYQSTPKSHYSSTGVRQMIVLPVPSTQLYRYKHPKLVGIILIFLNPRPKLQTLVISCHS